MKAYSKIRRATDIISHSSSKAGQSSPMSMVVSKLTYVRNPPQLSSITRSGVDFRSIRVCQGLGTALNSPAVLVIIFFKTCQGLEC